MDDFHPSLRADAYDEDYQDHLKKWSSFIGIITALCGNILISFALNIQKYAHIRLARERERQRIIHDKRANRQQNNYGTTREGDEDGRMESSWMSTVTERTEGSNEDEEEGGQGGMNGHSRESSTSKIVDSPTTPSKLYQEEPREEEEDYYTTPPYLRSGWWWTGIILMTLGECGNFLAYGFAPASIVSPLGVVALISNCIIAPVMLKEPFRGRDLLGVLVAIAGVVVVILSSKTEEIKLGPHEILVAISQTAFEVYFGITCGLMVFLMYISRKHGDRMIIIDLGLVALFGGYTALSTKGVSSLLTYTFYKIFTFPIFYLLVFTLVSTAILQIKYLNRALQRFDSTQVIPIQFVLFTLSVIIGSAILYRDFEKADGNQIGKFVAGCAFTFTGVYLITSQRPSSKDHFEFEDEEDAAWLEDGRYMDLPDGGPENITPHKPAAVIADEIPRPHSEPPLTPPTPQRMSSSRVASMALPDRSDPRFIPSSTPLTRTQSQPLRTSSTERTPTSSSANEQTSLLARAKTPSRTGSIAELLSSTPTPSAGSRRSTLLTPGPLFVGYQLQAIAAETLRRVEGNAPSSPTNQSSDAERQSLKQSIRKKLRIRKTRSHNQGLNKNGASSETEQTTSTPSRTERERRGTIGSAEGVAGRPNENNLEEDPSESSASEAGGQRVRKHLTKVLKIGGDAAPLPRPKPVHPESIERLDRQE